MSSTRIGNVAGAVVAGGAGARCTAPDGAAGVRAWASRLDGLFAETWVAGSTANEVVPGRRIAADPTAVDVDALPALVEVLGAASAERVLVVEPDAPLADVELLLALTAWPESEAVLYSSEPGRPVCAVYLREIVLERSRVDCVDLAQLLASLEVDPVDRHKLGLDIGGLC